MSNDYTAYYFKGEKEKKKEHYNKLQRSEENEPIWCLQDGLCCCLVWKQELAPIHYRKFHSNRDVKIAHHHLQKFIEGNKKLHIIERHMESSGAEIDTRHKLYKDPIKLYDFRI